MESSSTSTTNSFVHQGLFEKLSTMIKERILFMDGAMGTALQDFNLEEKDFKGQLFANHPKFLQGNNECLNLVKPDVVKAVYSSYLEAGSDIIETNTFNGNSISQSDYDIEKHVRNMNIQATRIARQAVDEHLKKTGKQCYIAGSIGPTNRTASISPQVSKPWFRNVTYVQLVESYAEQIRGLLDGGVDILLVETIFDTLNSKAAISSIIQVLAEPDYVKYSKVPVMISGTITDLAGRTLSGHTPEAFFIAVKHCPNILSIGLNCALGSTEMFQFVDQLSKICPYPVSCYSNAGKPDGFGGYAESPSEFAEANLEMAKQGLVNILGGCCGTTAVFIKALIEKTSKVAPRIPPAPSPYAEFSGLDMMRITPDLNFVNIGERCNIAGSRAFQKCIVNQNWDKALSIAQLQVQNGAQIIDINVDDGMIDGVAMMTKFCNILVGDPDICKVPFMIDSSDFSVIEAGLQCVAGRCIVNSISLKNGESDFLKQAAICKSYGAGVIVMAFDETGQATTTEHKVKICKRSYDLLTQKAGFNGNDIIFDPNILTVATGMTEHDDYARNFIEAIKPIKKSCPGSMISGGVSNLSFAFRGQNALREAMHSAFLYHAIKEGMDMGIVNAGQITIYDDIEKKLLKLIEDVYFHPSPQNTEKLTTYAEENASSLSASVNSAKGADLSWRELGIVDRIVHSLVKGIDTYVIEDVELARKDYAKTLQVIEGPLMKGMQVVGELFGKGKMFLPQVIKSARVMKKAVGYLQPLMEAESETGEKTANGVILMATVKGDVHDIGKNIVKVVLECNNYKVVDLGIMCGVKKIVDYCKNNHVDIIGLSGLITPSLNEIGFNMKEFIRAGITVPVMIGGATTSAIHTAVKIAPLYKPNYAIHVLDASKAVVVANNLLSDANCASYLEEVDDYYQDLVDDHFESKSEKEYLDLKAARALKAPVDWNSVQIVKPQKVGSVVTIDVPISVLAKFIDWNPFFSTYSLRGTYPTRNYPAIFNDSKVGKEAKKLFDAAQKLLSKLSKDPLMITKATFGFWPCDSNDDDIYLYEKPAEGSTDLKGKHIATLFGIRQQTVSHKSKYMSALGDFIMPKTFAEANKKIDYIGAFAVTAGTGIEKMISGFRESDDMVNLILTQSIADRLAEALAEYLHLRVRCHYWGYSPKEDFKVQDLLNISYQGIRPAPAYPSQPDHTEKLTLWKLLNPQKIGITLTENLAMKPAASVCGMYMANPHSHYFQVGKLKPDQVADYAARKGWTLDQCKQHLSHNLYED